MKALITPPPQDRAETKGAERATRCSRTSGNKSSRGNCTAALKAGGPDKMLIRTQTLESLTQERVWRHFSNLSPLITLVFLHRFLFFFPPLLLSSGTSLFELGRSPAVSPL